MTLRKGKDLKEEALDRTIWRARFGRGFGPVVRQTTKKNDRVVVCHISIDIRTAVYKFC